MIGLYRQCDQGMAGFRYPDGKALLDQPSVMLDAFNVIGRALHDFRPEKVNDRR